MADFLSKYTGQQIESILDSVDEKINKTDIVSSYQNDSQSPAAVSLAYELNEKIKAIDLSLSTNYLRIDSGTQTVNGAKTFASVIAANGGITVPTGKTITVIDEPVAPEQVANLSFVRKHGVSEDTAPAGSGLKIAALGTGYNSLALDVSRLQAYTDSALPIAFPVQTPTGTTQSWTISKLLEAIYADSRLTNEYVTQDAFELETQDLQDNKVSTTAYAQKMSEIDVTLAKKLDLSKTGSVSAPASGSTALPDFDKVNCTMLLVTATWGSVADVYRFTFGIDGTIKSEILVQKSTAGLVTAAGSIVSNKLHVTLSNANTTTAAAIDYKLIASF